MVISKDGGGRNIRSYVWASDTILGAIAEFERGRIQGTSEGGLASRKGAWSCSHADCLRLKIFLHVCDLRHREPILPREFAISSSEFLHCAIESSTSSAANYSFGAT
jgi:hypothetical protein